jgi:hypothetical protein
MFAGQLFPDSVHMGAHSEAYNRNYVNATIGSSFSCENGVLIDLGDVKINLTNLHLQAFFNKSPSAPFDTGM